VCPFPHHMPSMAFVNLLVCLPASPPRVPRKTGLSGN
jgi:hypothetical protein